MEENGRLGDGLSGDGVSVRARVGGGARLTVAVQRALFLGKLLLSPRFYEIIGEPLQNMSQLDTTLGTVCYGALFLSVLVRRLPKIRVALGELGRKVIKTTKSLLVQLLKQVLRAVSRMLTSASGAAARMGADSLLGLLLTLEELVSSSMSQLGKSSLEKRSAESKVSLEPTSVEAHVATTLRAVSRYLTDVRMFYRGFQIPESIAGLLATPLSLLKEGEYVEAISTVSICLYQPLETTAFLLEKGWMMPGGETLCDWYYIVSTRLWFVWVLVELAKALREVYGEGHRKGLRGVEWPKMVTALEHLATVPLCVHWSLPEGCLGDLGVGVFGTLAGGLSTVEIWRGVWRRLRGEFTQ